MIRMIIIAVVVTTSLMFPIILFSIEYNHLNKENEKFKAEIEYLVEQNEILIEENASLYDMYWIESNEEMKEGNN